METVKLGLLIKKTKVGRCGEHSYPVLSITKQNGIIMQSEKFKKRIASADTSDYKIIPRGKLIQGIHIDEGNFGIQDIVDNGIVSPAYGVWDVNDGLVIPKYLEMVLRSPKSIEFYRSKLTGTVNRRGHMSDTDFLSMDIPLPDRDTQSKILKTMKQTTSILCSRQQLAKLDELIKARFAELFGDLKSNSKGWPIVAFTECADIDTNMVHDFEGYEDYPHIGIDSIEKETGRLSGYRTVAEDGVISGKYLFTEKHIIYSKIRPNLNKVAMPDFSGVCSADAYPILVKDGVCSKEYLAYTMRSKYFLDYILAFSNRTNLPKVNKNQVEGFKLPLPPIDVQEQFVGFVKCVDKSKAAVQKSLDETQVLFDSLMQKYFG